MDHPIGPAIFSNDSESKERLDALGDDWQPLKVSELLVVGGAGEEEVLPACRQVRVYADGVYDLFHNGHAEQLRQAKNRLPNTYLIVGVCSDEDVLTFKGTKPVMTQEERWNTVRHCRYVDEVYKCPPFYPTLELIDGIKADFVAHDALPYSAPQSDDCYEVFKEQDRFLITHRTPSVSTTDLLSRIIDNYEVFLKREQNRRGLADRVI